MSHDWLDYVQAFGEPIAALVSIVVAVVIAISVSGKETKRSIGSAAAQNLLQFRDEFEKFFAELEPRVRVVVDRLLENSQIRDAVSSLYTDRSITVERIRAYLERDEDGQGNPESEEDDDEDTSMAELQAIRDLEFELPQSLTRLQHESPLQVVGTTLGDAGNRVEEEFPFLYSWLDNGLMQIPRRALRDLTPEGLLRGFMLGIVLARDLKKPPSSMDGILHWISAGACSYLLRSAIELKGERATSYVGLASVLARLLGEVMKPYLLLKPEDLADRMTWEHRNAAELEATLRPLRVSESIALGARRVVVSLRPREKWARQVHTRLVTRVEEELDSLNLEDGFNGPQSPVGLPQAT